MALGFVPALALPLKHTHSHSLCLRKSTLRRACTRAQSSRFIVCATASDLAPEAEAGAVQPSQGLGLLRIGHGYDLHRLEEGRPLILGGVELPHTVGCAGHSDGDAVYHCVVDAILGALSLPDIGQLFPDSDPRFKNCRSDVFMTACYARMHLAGFRLGNIDVTVILEKPKVSPHKESMRENIARLLNAPLDAVNLKAKTHEKVDAVGENRAVEVHAVAVLLRDTPGFPPLFPESPVAEVEEGPVQLGREATEQLLKSVAARVSTVTGITASAKENGVDSSHDNDDEVECPVERLYESVVSRRGADPASSWTAKLFSKGRQKIAQKVGEEAVEVVIDAVADKKEDVVKESADLMYHLNVLWADMGIKPGDVFAELKNREGTSGIKEKASRKA